MCLLSDDDLSARLALLTPDRIVVAPLAEDAIQPASIDVRLGESMFYLMPTHQQSIVHPYADHTFRQTPVPMREFDGEQAWLLHPRTLYLATTLEWICVPDDLTGQLVGKSSRARVGIVPHQQAGLLDPGYEGRPTWEITVVYPTLLFPGMTIGQVTFTTMTRPATYPYGHPSRKSRYQGDTEPTMARSRPKARP